MPGEVRMGELVTGGGSVSLSIRKVFENRRNRVGLGILWKPYPSCQTAAVGERDEEVLDFANGAGKRLDHFHAHAPRTLLFALANVKRLELFGDPHRDRVTFDVAV